MKKLIILIALVFTALGYSQAEFEKIAITENTATAETSRIVSQQPVGGELNYIDAADLPVSSAGQAQLDKKDFLSTGLKKFGEISINTSTTYNISEGLGVIANWDDPDNPDIKLITIPATTAKTPSYINTSPVTYIACDDTGTIVEQSSPFTIEQRRDLIVLGNVVHSNFSTITFANSIPAYINSPTNQLHDIIDFIGNGNKTGNKYTANGANLSLDRSAGVIFKFGIGAADNWKRPHEKDMPALTALTFNYRFQNGTNLANTTVLNPDIYDVGGVSTPVPNNKYTIQTVILFQTGNTVILPGQTVYDNISQAEAAINTRNFVYEPASSANGFKRAYIIMKQGTTSLLNPVNALIVDGGKIDGISSGGGGAVTADAIFAALGYTPENQANKSSSYTVSSTTKYPNTKALVDGLATKNSRDVTKFSKEYFTSITGFTSVGSNTISYSDGRMVLSGGTGAFTNYLTIDGLKNTDESIELEVIFKATTLGTGIGIGKKSINTWNAVSTAVTLNTSLSNAYIYNIETSTTTGPTTRQLRTVVANDIIKLTYKQTANTIICYFENLTTGDDTQIVFVKQLGVSESIGLPNSSDIALVNLGGTNEIISLKVKSLSTITPDVVVIGDSKSVGSSAIRNELRYASKLSNLGNVVVQSGNADRTVEAAQTIDYTKTLKAKYAIINIGRNDLASSVPSGTWQANYANIVSQLQAQGTTVYHLLPIPETTLADQSALNTWIIATYGVGNTIDPSVGFNTGTMLNADGIHPNELGHQHIANAILSSGLIPSSSYSEPKEDFVYSDNNIIVRGVEFGGAGTSQSNTKSGRGALGSLGSGFENTGNGVNALGLLKTGSFNTAIGGAALYSLDNSDQNTATGDQAGFKLLTASNIVLNGFRAGRYLVSGADATSLLNSIMIGNDTRPLLDGDTNEIVIAHNGRGLGSNTSVFGNSSTTFGRWWGRLLVGKSTDDGINDGQFNGTVSSGNTTFGTSQPTANNQLTRKDYTDAALALKANLASPAFTGTPTAPTATAGTNTTQIATTAYVDNAVGAAAEPYLVYTALLSQSGTSAPTATVLRNTTGATVTYAYTNPGLYTATFSSAVLTTNKTAPILTKGDVSGEHRIGIASTSVLNITVTNNGGSLTDSFISNSLLEVRIYP